MARGDQGPIWSKQILFIQGRLKDFRVEVRFDKSNYFLPKYKNNRWIYILSPRVGRNFGLRSSFR